MFGMGFAEIMVIAVIAILFLGPDKLPQTLIDVARFFRETKRSILHAKESIEEELHIEDIKKEAMQYRRELEEGTRELERLGNIDEQSRKPMLEPAPQPPVEAASEPPKPAAPEVITFAKKRKPEDDSAPKGA